jgi:hypothetical protein
LTLHIIGTSPIPSQVGYHRSTDAGATWECDRYLGTHQGIRVDADSYDITADGDTVAIVVAGAGGDVVVFESTDAGETWTETIIYDIDETGKTAGDEPADGSCSILYDSNGILHASWGSFRYDELGLFSQSREAGIRHWSNATGEVREVAYPDPDTTIVDPGGRDGNFASQPDLAADQDGTIIIVYSAFIPETDSRGKYYEHVFATASSDGGISWGGSLDITPGSGYDAAWPSVADLADTNIHLTYTSDPFAGNWLQGIHEQIAVPYMYHKVSVGEILQTVTVDEAPPIPSDQLLEQNYPNPFNASTQIRFSLARSGDVQLSIFNLIGEEVVTLVTGHYAAGIHTIQWDATGQPSGVYFCRLWAGGFVGTKKLVLLR